MTYDLDTDGPCYNYRNLYYIHEYLSILQIYLYLPIHLPICIRNHESSFKFHVCIHQVEECLL